jgi:hypothetical protein
MKALVTMRRSESQFKYFTAGGDEEIEIGTHLSGSDTSTNDPLGPALSVHNLKSKTFLSPGSNITEADA